MKSSRLIQKAIAIFTLVLILTSVAVPYGSVCDSKVIPLYSFVDELPYEEVIQEIRVGDSVYFGVYEQDNRSSNGKEDIEWIVLEIRDDKALILSKYILDAIPYNKRDEYVTWASCSLRKWLNSTFISTAFSDSEASSIVPVLVKNYDNDEYHISGGNDTCDQVFLLSYDDAISYFEHDSDRRAGPTEYARSHDVNYGTESGCSWWWLRSPGKTSNRAGNVVNRGVASTFGAYVNADSGGVRPALWVEKDALTNIF